MDPQPDLVGPEETVDGVPVLAAEVRALERAAPQRRLPAVQAAAVVVAGAATVVAIGRHVARRPARAPRRRKRGAGPETLSVLGTRSFLVDVHLLGRE